jgi:hypothetical protein
MRRNTSHTCPTTAKRANAGTQIRLLETHPGGTFKRRSGEIISDDTRSGSVLGVVLRLLVAEG